MTPGSFITDSLEGETIYPKTLSERDAFRTENGKRVPPHHWAVYDLIRTIPVGKVSTYKDVCAALGEGSPRSVGGALRNNPFAPRIPCHRVIASSFFVGGFKGEWTSSSPVENVAEKKNWHEPFKGGGMGPLQNEKVRMLVQEGVEFGKDGKILVSRDAVWKFDGGLDAEK
jgi:methylated-DNA-[protein]-cysteine S-methyltransferase